MAISSAEYTVHDQRIWDEELDDFVPSKIFDAHIHLFDRTHVPSKFPCVWQDSNFASIQDWAERLYPGRKVHFLVLGTPAVGVNVQEHVQWQIEQIRQDPCSRLNRLVTPACSAEEILRDIQQAGVIGLKPYRLFSTTGDVAQCRIHEFLTEAQLEIANEHRLWVTMHLSRFDGPADEENLRDLEEYTIRKYPGIRWILAHCARSFTYWPIRQAIARLRELPNIWYDVSAVTDVRPLITLFSQEDSRRIFYGSDGVDATYFHGQYTAFGRAWQTMDVSKNQLAFPHCEARPILAIYEQLLSMKHAAEIAGLSREAIERIFWGNAVEAFDINVAR